MALMLGQLYDALRAGNVPDDKARAAAEEVANYEGERASVQAVVWKWANGLNRVEAEVRLLKWMIGFLIASSSVCSRCNGRFC